MVIPELEEAPVFSELDDSLTISELEDSSVFAELDEPPFFIELDDLSDTVGLENSSIFAEPEEPLLFTELDDSTSCSREELDSTNSGWVDELLELSSPQDTNRQTALNGINNRFNMDIRSLLQVHIDQYIHFLDLFHPDRAKNTVQRRKKTAIKAARNCSKLLNFTSFCNSRLGAICKEIPAYAGMTRETNMLGLSSPTWSGMTRKGCGYAPVGGQGTVPRLHV